jgi:hypothetical protein
MVTARALARKNERGQWKGRMESVSENAFSQNSERTDQFVMNMVEENVTQAMC